MNNNYRLTSLAMEGYRCFRAKQSVRLAPLTFLVGANSTGKTSFLAILRAIWNVVINGEVPDFREDPYDLGTFHDIVYTNGDSEQLTDTFAAELHFVTEWNSTQEYYSAVTFDERGGSPFPFKRHLSHDNISIEVEQQQDGPSRICIVTPTNTWEYSLASAFNSEHSFQLLHLYFCLHILQDDRFCVPTGDHMSSLSESDLSLLQDLIGSVYLYPHSNRSVFASAPVRSRPKRTYDPTRPSRDAEGQYVPTYLATVNYRNQEEWRIMKGRLEQFGSEMGLFDEILIRKLGGDLGGPFQLQVKQAATSPERTTTRNLIDVGYGVSQVLPLLTELLRPDSGQIFFLQQPEVHLHPSAQAALGSLFSTVSSEQKQLIIETHSDYLINRVRMDIRDKKNGIQARDISILFFESRGLDVEIHSINIDSYGNVLGAPSSYRKFFMEEIEREISV